MRGSLGRKIGHQRGLHLGIRGTQRLVSGGLGNGRVGSGFGHGDHLRLSRLLLARNQAIKGGLGPGLGFLPGCKIDFLFRQIRSLLVHRRLGSDSGGLGSLGGLVG